MGNIAPARPALLAPPAIKNLGYTRRKLHFLPGSMFIIRNRKGQDQKQIAKEVKPTI